MTYFLTNLVLYNNFDIFFFSSPKSLSFRSKTLFQCWIVPMYFNCKCCIPNIMSSHVVSFICHFYQLVHDYCSMFFLFFALIYETVLYLFIGCIQFVITNHLVCYIFISFLPCINIFTFSLVCKFICKYFIFEEKQLFHCMIIV